MSRITKDNDISELQSEKDVLKNAVTNAVGVKDYIKNVFTGEFGRARRKKLAGVRLGVLLLLDDESAL